METRFKVSKTDLESIKNDLKSQGLTLNEINQRIDAEFRNYLYQGRSMSADTFEKLEDLCGYRIEHESGYFLNGRGFVNVQELEENEELAELVGILLGDGHLHEDSENGIYYISITLHEDEEQIIERSRYLLEKIFGKQPSFYSNKSSKGIQLRLEDKIVLLKLKEKGLEAGNKVENQIGVPKWIKENRKYQKYCLKGLIDTDGTIYRRNEDNYYVAQFKNRSQKLLNDFKEICEELDIKCSNAGEHQVQIASQSEVRKLVSSIQPVKMQRHNLKETLLKS